MGSHPIATEQRTTGERDAHGDHRPQDRRELVLGLLAAPGLAHEIAEELAEELPATLAERYEGVDWRIALREEPHARASADPELDLVDVARKRLLDEGWDLAICLTDLPLLIGRRPVTAHASTSLGVGLISVPALGAVALDDRVREAVLRVTDRLLGHHEKRRRKRKRRSPVGRSVRRDDGGVRFVAAPVPGGLRLLIGMIRANRPWRLIIGLSKAGVGALGTTAAGLASTGVWNIADGMSAPRVVGVALLSIAVTVGALIAVHHLWERAPRRGARRRVVLFNLATTATVTLGVIILYAALVVISLVAGALLIAPHVLSSQVNHPVDAVDYVRLACMVGSMATVGGALGSALESNRAVREAAYGYRADDADDA